MAPGKYACFLFLLSAVAFSCKKDSFITSPQASLSTSADTLFFDTVFATAGSITESFKIFNNNNQKLLLSKVKLAGGSASAFTININGMAAPEADNIAVNANDSLYVFVQVRINPNSDTLPFIIRDSILISYNGNQQFVQLQAYGQNAHFLNAVTLSGQVTWNNTLPYVILGGLLVDSTATLTIQPGTRIYLHATSPFLVDGTLVVNGTRQDSVVFNGDRLDPDYSNLPASWPGIFFSNRSTNNFLKHAVIKNAYQGLIVQGNSLNANAKLTLSQCVLDNIYDAGLLGINTSIKADNCLITNCGSNILLELGGNYQFVSCTVASYNNLYIAHQSPVLQVSNAASQNGVTLTAPLTALFQNCIFWGDFGTVNDEIAINFQGNNAPVSFDHVLYKAKDNITNANFDAQSIKNVAPLFDSVGVISNFYDFHLQPNSPAIHAGVVTAFALDLDDQPRGAQPDIGCYQQ